MVVLYCPVCGEKILIKGVPAGEVPLSFKHCGFEVIIKPEEKKSKDA